MFFYNGSLPQSDGSVFIRDTPLTNTNKFTYLGFTFTTRLSYSLHAANLCNKAEARIGLLFHRLPLHNLPIQSVISVFNLYVLPIFRYGLFLWFPFCSASSRERINSVFTKFLKRYLRIPKHSENALTHLITNTQPLSVTLTNLLQSSYSSLILPDLFSGFRPSIVDHLPCSILNYNASDLISPHYRQAPLPTFLATNPSRRHKVLSYTFDSIHYSYCNSSLFHFPSDSCICKFCLQQCPYFHFQSCPAGII